MHYLGTTCAAIFSHSDIVLLKLASCNCCVSICVHLNSIRTLWWSTCRHSHNFWDPPPTHTHTDINTNIQFAIIATWSVSNVVVRIYWRWQLLESRTYYKIKLDYDYFIFYFHFFYLFVCRHSALPPRIDLCISRASLSLPWRWVKNTHTTEEDGTSDRHVILWMRKIMK